MLDRRRRLTAGELATAMHLTSGAITSVIDRLTDEQLELLLEFTRRGRAWTEQRVARAQALRPAEKGRKRLRGRGRA